MPHSSAWSQRLSQLVSARSQAGLLRQRRCVEHLDGRRVKLDGQLRLQFASNDYLGLAFAPDDITPLGAGASALVSGYHRAHQQLEQRLCQLTGFEAALLFSSGFAANSAPLALLQSGDRLLADKLIHASVVDAAQASPASLRRFPHNNTEVLSVWLALSQSLTLVATESVFSMDGDQAPLAEIVKLCRQHGALSWIDDAHGFGVLGPQGLGASELAKPDLLTVTFGKALGASGAALLGSKALIEAIVQSSRHYTYSTAMPVDQAARVSDRLARLQSGAQRQRLFERVEQFKALAQKYQLPLLPSNSPIQPLLCASSEHALALTQRLLEQGIWVPAIRPPTVQKPRLRIVINSCHLEEDIEQLVSALVAHYQHDLPVSLNQNAQPHSEVSGHLSHE